MNEAETRAELIDPALAAAGWHVVDDSLIRREVPITAGRIQPGGKRGKALFADYVLVHRGKRLAVIEAKRRDLDVSEGVSQAKDYAGRLNLTTAFAANGRQIYRTDLDTGNESFVDAFPTPEELWRQTFPQDNDWRDTFAACPMHVGERTPRAYQENAIEAVTDAIAAGDDRLLLTLATGTGKTFIAFQIAWKLFQTRWNLRRDGRRRPRILFLADRNILANQAFNDFSAFDEDALVRISPKEVRKAGRVPTSGNVFFTIFQTFTSGDDDAPYFGEYPPDFFDFIIIDECHRGGANDESSWRAILDHFAPAVQLGMTATPKRDANVDTYSYFGESVYVYSLRDGIADGFLTPFKVKRIQTTIDTYVYTSDDQVVAGEVDHGREYTEADFNRTIRMRQRDEVRVKEFLQATSLDHKALLFCRRQDHAAIVRDLVNQNVDHADPLFCCRVTANDGEIGVEHLLAFKDDEKTIPRMLTTSRKLSTGVDAPQIRSIVLLRPCNNMIEFKQIIGRGTRLFDGKDHFTIYDFVGAYQNFMDPDWDGEPVAPEPAGRVAGGGGEEAGGDTGGGDPPPFAVMTEVKLSDGKVRQIQSMTSTMLYGPDGRPMSVNEFIKELFGALPRFYTTEAELCELWSRPETRHELLSGLEDAGFGPESLATVQELIAATDADLFDVLEYISYARPPVPRRDRADAARTKLDPSLSAPEREFIDFVLDRYVETGIDALNPKSLPELLVLKYDAISDAQTALGSVVDIRTAFVDFQRKLYLAVAG